MSTCPRWAQNNARRVIDLVTFDRRAFAQKTFINFNGQMTPRRFRRAALAMPNSKIIGSKREKVLGWQRTLIAEDERDGLDASISLVRFIPFLGPVEFELRTEQAGLIIHRHALDRLFERAIQPPEGVAKSLLDPHFLNHFPDMDENASSPGFATPFRNGRFVGSFEWVRDIDGTLTGIFGVRSWLPEPISAFTWTNRGSRTYLKAIEIEHRKQILDRFNSLIDNSMDRPSPFLEGRPS